MNRLLTLLALLVTVFSCKPVDEIIEGKPELVLLSESDVSVSPDGGEQKISVKINNQVDGGKLKASSKAAWIEDIAVISEGEVSFNVLKNEDRSSRSATIKVSYIYPDGADYINVELTQSGVDGGDISISVQNIDYQVADIVVEPSDDKFLYVVRVVPESEFDSSLDDSKRFEKEMEYYQKYAESNGISLISSLEKNGGYGRRTFRKQDLKLGTSYYAYAFGVSSDLELITSFEIEQFKTKEVEMTDFKISAELNIDALSVNVDVVPENNEKCYYMDVVEIRHLEQYGDNIEAMVNAMVLEIRQAYVNMGNDIDKFLLNKCYSGPQEFEKSSLDMNTEYAFVAVGLNDDAIPDSPVCFKEFKTGVAGNPAELTVEFEIYDIRYDVATVNAMPSDKMVLYVWSIAIDDATPETQMQFLKDMADYSSLSLAEYLKRQAVRGDNRFQFRPLEPGKKYSLYYIGLNEDGSPATDVVIDGEFTTLK